ncbi:hypothetical protein PMAYCL1PPCAC_22897, partial [Pristionchus mayeri]
RRQELGRNKRTSAYFKRRALECTPGSPSYLPREKIKHEILRQAELAQEERLGVTLEYRRFSVAIDHRLINNQGEGISLRPLINYPLTTVSQMESTIDRK